MIKLIKFIAILTLIIIAGLYIQDHGWAGRNTNQLQCETDQDCLPENYEPSITEMHKCIMGACYYVDTNGN